MWFGILMWQQWCVFEVSKLLGSNSPCSWYACKTIQGHWRFLEARWFCGWNNQGRYSKWNQDSPCSHIGNAPKKLLRGGRSCSRYWTLQLNTFALRWLIDLQSTKMCIRFQATSSMSNEFDNRQSLFFNFLCILCTTQLYFSFNQIYRLLIWRLERSFAYL